MRKAIPIVVLISLLGLIGLVYAWAQTPTVTARNNPTTRLYIRTIPVGAKITIDGNKIGPSDRLLLVSPGVRKITLELDDHIPYVDSVEVLEGHIRRLEIELKPLASTSDSTPAKPTEDLERLPPVVVTTWPRAGDTRVDASLDEIRVTFSKPMQDRNWSWVQMSEESFPPMTAEPHYLPDQRTCLAPVTLQPGTTYAVWLNSSKFGNFKDTHHRAAVPYLLVFETRSKHINQTSTEPPKEEEKNP